MLGLMTLEETLFGQIWNSGDNREPEILRFESIEQLLGLNDHSMGRTECE